MRNKITSGTGGRLAATGAAFTALLVTLPAAQAGTMGNGAAQRIMVQVRRCLGMSHDDMMKDQACKSMMAAHPELFPAGTAKPKSEP